MKPCKLTIITNTDGQENSITRNGEMEISQSSLVLRYREENAMVYLRIEGDSAQIERQGDYSLKLCLKQNVLTQGEIGIGGSNGSLQTLAHEIAYSKSEQAILVTLQYDLIIGQETQKMRLRILGT